MLDGMGAYNAGGRWNSKGMRAVYFTETLSLATLEILVHIRIPAVLARYRCVEVEIEENLLVDLGGEIPEVDQQGTGDAILLEGKDPGFMAASLATPHERNVVLNPDFPGLWDLISIVLEVYDYPIDRRLVS